MPHGVPIIAESREAAIEQFRSIAPDQTILSVRQIDFTGIPPLKSGPFPTYWALVVEHLNPEIEMKFEQDDDPAIAVERSIRLMYLQLSLDPSLLVSGMRESVRCPACSEVAMIDLPPERVRKSPFQTKCPGCRAPIRRLAWNSWESIDTEVGPYPTCVFCAAPANSREHAIPAWISRRLNIQHVSPPDAAFVTDGQRPNRTFSFANYRARVFCADCNEHFKHLEDEVVPVVAPIAKGMQVVLGPEIQATLALWASKTAVAIGAAEGLHSRVSQIQKDRIRLGKIAPSSFWIRWFSWSGPGPVMAVAPFDGSESGFAVFLAFGRVGFCVACFSQDTPISQRTTAKAGIQLNPPRHPLIQFPTFAVSNGVSILQVLTELPDPFKPAKAA